MEKIEKTEKFVISSSSLGLTLHDNCSAPESNKQNAPDRTLDLPFFFHYKDITSLKNLPSPLPNESLPYWFQGNFAASLVLNFCLREFLCLRPRLHDTVFISYRIGFISDWPSVYTIPFAFHIGLASCLHENAPIRYASYRFRVFK